MVFPDKRAAAAYVGCSPSTLTPGRRRFPKLGFDMYDDTPDNAAYAKCYTTHETDTMIWPLWYLRKGLAPASSYGNKLEIGNVRRECND